MTISGGYCFDPFVNKLIDWLVGWLTDNNNNNDRLTAFDPGQPG